MEIINSIINKEFEQFKINFDIQPIPESQDISSLSIAWLCYSFKERISKENQSSIKKFCDDILKSKEYNTKGWSRIPAILAANFVLTNKEKYLNEILKNISCHQSSNRGFIMKSLSIISPLIPSDNEYLRNGTEINLIRNHGYSDTGVIIYMNTNGGIEEKREFLREIIKKLPDSYDEFLNKILKGESVKDDFYNDTLNEVKSYILSEIFNNNSLMKVENISYDDASETDNFLDSSDYVDEYIAKEYCMKLFENIILNRIKYRISFVNLNSIVRIMNAIRNFRLISYKGSISITAFYEFNKNLDYVSVTISEDIFELNKGGYIKVLVKYEIEFK